MESYSRPEVKETLVNNGKIYESSGNISVSSSKYVNSNETENVDLSILDGTSAVSPQKEILTNINNSPDIKENPDIVTIDEVVNTIVDVNDKVSNATLNVASNILMRYQLQKDALIIYDSFHGKENEPASNFLDEFLFDRFEKILSDHFDKKYGKGNKDVKSILEEKAKKYNTESREWADEIEKNFKEKTGSHFDKDYKFGKNWKLDSVDIFKKNLWNYSDEYWIRGKSLNGKWGKAAGSIRVNAFDTKGTVRVGPDHVILDASVEYDAVEAKGMYEAPGLMSKDGLELYSVGVGGEVSLFHAEAKARAGAGWFKDEDGEAHVEAGVQLKAEADLVKASVTGSTTVLGVTARGTAGVKIGIGAQLDVGFVDKELKCNLSLSAGLGFEVGISLDFSKLSDYFTKSVPRQRDVSTMVGSGIW